MNRQLLLPFTYAEILDNLYLKIKRSNELLNAKIMEVLYGIEKGQGYREVGED